MSQLFIDIIQLLVMCSIKSPWRYSIKVGHKASFNRDIVMNEQKEHKAVFIHNPVTIELLCLNLMEGIKI